jgi:adenosine deaminase
MLPPTLDAFITRMPKVELHLHLEGSITPATLLKIAQRNNVDIPARDEAGVAQLFNYKNFHEFLTVFMALARSLIRGEETSATTRCMQATPIAGSKHCC